MTYETGNTFGDNDSDKRVTFHAAGAKWDGTRQSGATISIYWGERWPRAVAGQTLQIPRKQGETREEFVRKRAQQVQAYADSQHRCGVGGHAFLSLSKYMGRTARHGNTWADHMMQYWGPGCDDTSWMLWARTNLFTSPMIRECREHLSVSTLHALA